MLCPPHKKKRLLRQPLFIKCNYFNVIAPELEFPGLWGSAPQILNLHGLISKAGNLSPKIRLQHRAVALLRIRG